MFRVSILFALLAVAACSASTEEPAGKDDAVQLRRCGGPEALECPDGLVCDGVFGEPETYGFCKKPAPAPTPDAGAQ